MSRRKRASRNSGDKSLEPGQDSFLDVVANLIGILIILVMLIGTQAQSAWEKIRAQKNTEDEELKSLEAGIGLANTSIAKLKSENAEIESAIVKQQGATEVAKQQRDRIQLAINLLQEEIKKKRQDLSTEDQQNQQLATEAEKLKAELNSIVSKTESLASSEVKTGVIEHLPTPIAKTVFGEELHFRLLGGKIVHVPLNDLVLEMKSEWKVKAKKLLQAPSTIETVGPVDNFRLQYKLILKEQVQNTENGIVRSTIPSLERFILLPTKEGLGEPVDEALQPGSQFARRIQSLDPNDVTISIWVYPDSFGQFPRLKKVLYEKGFLCAGWPLPENQPISGSPNGFRTAAQ